MLTYSYDTLGSKYLPWILYDISITLHCFSIVYLTRFESRWTLWISSMRPPKHRSGAALSALSGRFTGHLESELKTTRVEFNLYNCTWILEQCTIMDNSCVQLCTVVYSCVQLCTVVLILILESSEFMYNISKHIKTYQHNIIST